MVKGGFKRFIIFSMVLVLVFSVIGCSKKTETDAPDGQDNGKEQGSKEETTFVIKDHAGREVEIPKDVKSVAYVYGVATDFIISLGKADMITAANISSDFTKKIAPQLENVDTVGRGKPDLEALAIKKPDVFFHKANDTETLEAVQELGIAAIGFLAEDTKGIMDTVELFGKVLGAEERAEELIDYYNKNVDFAKDITKDLADKDKKTAIVMGSEIGKVANGEMLQSFLIETAGGINPATELETKELWPIAGTEQIFSWDPDFIFCANSSSNTYTIEDFKKDPAMKNLSAVKNNRVLLVPSDLDSWEFPGTATALGFLWMMNQMYPELYPEEEFLAKVDDFYEFTYGMTFDREWLGY